MIPKPILARLLSGRPRPSAPEPSQEAEAAPAKDTRERPKEIGGPALPEPTRYGDWERNGRCIDF